MSGRKGTNGAAHGLFDGYTPASDPRQIGQFRTYRSAQRCNVGASLSPLPWAHCWG